MKKIIALLSLALFINVAIAKAQSPAASTTEPKKEVVKTDASKQCTGVTPACPHPCIGEKASGTSSTVTLSENHSNAGTTATSEKKSASSTCTDKSACTGKETKACCKSSSKASAMTMRTKPVKATTDVAPKEATPATPQQ